MKNILFINLTINGGYQTGVNHGIAHLVTIAKEYSYKVNLLNLFEEIGLKEFEYYVKKYNPNIVAFSLPSQQQKYLIKYSSGLKGFSDALSIAGGIGPTLDPSGFLEKSSLDGVCIGEGEIPFRSLLENIKKNKRLTSTEGFYWRSKNTIIKNRIPLHIENLSSLPFPDYSIFGGRVKEKICLILSRGCIFDCTYCCSSSIRSIYKGYNKPYFRVPTVKYSISFLEDLIKKYPPIKYIYFQDDLLIANKRWFKKFAEEYTKRIKVPYKINVRVECVDQEIVESLKKSGCDLVHIGLECGNERFRRDILNRGYTNQDMLRASKMLKGAGLKLFTFNIVGFPGETKSTMRETLELNKKIEPYSGVCTFFYPYKGTKLYNLCKEGKLLINDSEIEDITNFNSKPSIKMDKDLEKYCVNIQKKMNKYFTLRKVKLSE